MGRKSLYALILRAPLCGANNEYQIVFAEVIYFTAMPAKSELKFKNSLLVLCSMANSPSLETLDKVVFSQVVPKQIEI